MKRILAIAALGLMLFSAGACNSRPNQPGGPATGQRLNGGGSSLAYPMMSKWTSVYDKEKGVKVNYQSVGSGGGIQQMTAKTFDFGCTDAPLNEEQLAKVRATGGEVLHLPLVMGAVVPAYNLPGVAQRLKFTGPLLADIFLEKITKWNDPALQAINPGVAFPDQGIVVVHRSDGSGTTYTLVDYLAKVSPGWKTKVGVGTSVKWPTGIGQKGSEGVSGQIARSPGSIGYVELIYALQNKISFGSVQNKAGVFMTASVESITAAAATELPEIPEDLRFSLTDPPGKDSYPISATVWAVIYANQPGSKGQAIVDFLRWTIHEGQQFAKDLDYARLPEGLIERVEKKLEQVQVSR